MIRCTKTSVAHLPHDWDKAQIKNISTQIKSGGSFGFTKIKDYQNHGFAAYSAAGQDGYVSKKEFEGHGVVVSSIGARCGKCFYAQGQWTTLANTQAILTDESIFSSKFLWYLIDDETYWHRSGTAQPFIKPIDIHNAWVPNPPIQEQRTIVEKLDKLRIPINSHEKDIQHIEKLKQGMLQQLKEGSFFKEEPTRYRLKNISKIRMGETLVANTLTGDGLPVFSADTGVGPWGYTSTSRNTFHSGTIILSARGSIGHPRLPTFQKYISTQTTIAIIPEKELVLPEYLHIWLQTISYKRLTSVQAIPMLTVSDMKEVNIMLPDQKTQANIAKTFASLQKMKTLHREQISIYKKLFYAMKFKLLYGKTRVEQTGDSL